ncbi:MAG: type II secretion system F family protein [Firmicutes bacterium]|nr:type II secretion system F family protein [Bacillota bacterium]
MLLGISLKTQAVFFRQMATMINAGLTANRMVVALESQSSDKLLVNILREIEPKLSAGYSLSDALSLYPDIFSEFTINMIRAGEVGGMLEVRLKDLADYLEKTYKYRMKVISKLVYPAILFHAGIFLPPLFLLFTQGMGAYIKATLGIIIPVYALAAGVYVAIKILSGSSGVLLTIDTILLGVPILGGFIKKLAITKFIRAFADLYEAGISLSDALSSSAKACGNLYMANKFLSLTRTVGTAATLTQAMRGLRLFPEMVLQMMETGEESGNVSSMLKKVNEYMETELEESSNRFLTVLPVIMLFIMGIYTGVIMFNFFKNLYSPLNELFPK